MIIDDPQRTASEGEAPLDNLYKGNLVQDCDNVRSEYWTPAGKIQETEMAKYMRITQESFGVCAAECAGMGFPLSLGQQRQVSMWMALVYQDGMIAALREQTDKIRSEQ